MSRLRLTGRLARLYDQAVVERLLSEIEQQVNRISFESFAAAPTTGTWVIGTIVWNSAPASAGPIGWVCTVTGTPGTWAAFGTIA